MAKRETRQGEDWDDLSPEAVRRMWEELETKTSEDDPICAHCVNMVWPARVEGDRGPMGWRVRYPVCPCHADSPGEPREVDPCGSCPNFRPRP